MEILLRYFPHLTEVQKKQFAQLLPLYAEWNEKINLISRKDIDNLYERHVLHSMAIAKLIEFAPNTHVMDVGTGGGFPGIPLAILFPEVHFHLVDSIGKKLKVVHTVAEAIGLQNVVITHDRVENIPQTFDFCVNRAVANLSKLHKWVYKKVKKQGHNAKPNGIISLKGGDLLEEITEYADVVELHNLRDWFSEEFFLTKKILYAPLGKPR